MSRAYAIAVQCIMCGDQINHGGAKAGSKVAKRSSGLPALAHDRKCCAAWKGLPEEEQRRRLGFKGDAMPATVVTNGHVVRRRVTRPRAPLAVMRFIAARVATNEWTPLAMLDEVLKAFPEWADAAADGSWARISNETLRQTMEHSKRFVPDIPPEHYVPRFPKLPAETPQVPPPTAPTTSSSTVEYLAKIADLAAQGLKILAMKPEKEETIRAAWKLIADEL